MGEKHRARARAKAALHDELRAARIVIDRTTIEKIKLLHTVSCLEEENEALREMLALVTKGGASAAL